MTITLTNTTRRMKVINLPHDVYCAAAARCACDSTRGRPTPSALTLAAGTSAQCLDEAVLRVPEIARDVRAGALRVRREVEKAAPPVPAATKPETAPRKARRRSGRKKAR